MVLSQLSYCPKPGNILRHGAAVRQFAPASQEHDILLDPDHPAFRGVRLVERFLFAVDSRLSP